MRKANRGLILAALPLVLLTISGCLEGHYRSYRVSLEKREYTPELATRCLSVLDCQPCGGSGIQSGATTCAKCSGEGRLLYLDADEKLDDISRPPTLADDGSRSWDLDSQGRPKTIYVRSYTRSNGTVVASHFRAPPESYYLLVREPVYSNGAENGSYYGQVSDSTGRPKTVYVNGYYRKDGTYVRSHYRSTPRRK